MREDPLRRNQEHRGHGGTRAVDAISKDSNTPLRSPPHIAGEPQQPPCPPSPQPALARMLATHPEPSSQFSVKVSTIVWYIYDGKDWPQRGSNATEDRGIEDETVKRGPLHLEVWLTGLLADHRTFPSSSEGDPEW